MNVGDLRLYFANLRAALEAGGAKAVAADLAHVEAGLLPFETLSVRQFADFLASARAAPAVDSSTPASPSTRTRKSTPPKAEPGADVLAVADKVRSLYERAIEPAMTEARLVEELTPLLAPLAKDALVVVAERMELSSVRNKSKAVIQDAIRKKILDRRDVFVRTSMVI